MIENPSGPGVPQTSGEIVDPNRRDRDATCVGATSPQGSDTLEDSRSLKEEDSSHQAVDSTQDGDRSEGRTSMVEEPKKSWWRKALEDTLLRRMAIISLIAVGFGWRAWRLIGTIPPEIQVFAGLIIVSIYLVAGGLAALIFVIPATGPSPEIKTEFYSARGAYFCVIAGLALVILVSVGLIVAIQTGGVHVLGTK